MSFIGIVLCILAAVPLYRRFSLIMFGESAAGKIVGHEWGVSVRGLQAYHYKVKYTYQNQEHTAKSLEFVQVSVFRNRVPQKNLEKQVTVYFKKSKPELVTVQEVKNGVGIGLFVFAICLTLTVLAIVYGV